MEKHITLSGPAKTGREEQLQFLRFLAFLNIYIYHADSWMIVPYPISHCGPAAVAFFFVLSGMVIGYSSYGRDIRLDARSYGAYMWKRLMRVYPMYLVTNLVAVLYSSIPDLIAADNFAAAAQRGEQLMKHLLMIQCWFQEGVLSFNGGTWYLAVLMFLTLFNLPVMWLLNKIRKWPYWRVLFLAGIVGCWGAAVVYCYLVRGDDMQYWHFFFPPSHLFEYFAGMLLGCLLRDGVPKIKSSTAIRILMTAAEIFVLYNWIRALYHPGNYWRHHIVSWMLPNLLILTVFTIGRGWLSELFRLRPLRRLGDISFECYLVHTMILTLYTRCNNVSDMSDAGKVFSMVFCLVITLACAHMLNKPAPQKRA